MRERRVQVRVGRTTVCGAPANGVTAGADLDRGPRPAQLAVGGQRCSERGLERGAVHGLAARLPGRKLPADNLRLHACAEPLPVSACRHPHCNVLMCIRSIARQADSATWLPPPALCTTSAPPATLCKTVSLLLQCRDKRLPLLLWQGQFVKMIPASWEDGTRDVSAQEVADTRSRVGPPCHTGKVVVLVTARGHAGYQDQTTKARNCL